MNRYKITKNVSATKTQTNTDYDSVSSETRTAVRVHYANINPEQQ